MKYNYQPLCGICAKCKYKCGRLEEPNFKGIWRCEYYIEEEQKKNWEQKKH